MASELPSLVASPFSHFISHRALEQDAISHTDHTSGEKDRGEPEDAELVRLSKRLVESAVLKAVQQYLEETQNKKQPGEGNSTKAEEANQNGKGSENNRK
ncbi:hypothetical protein A6R68_09702 [Neotoma lepida]|uniref:A-kinase anchor protein 7 RI-RII subunit-binding domain-containing protein n=1 Tax=Neotoma lepida TaxID=56216 RepID=A0A1A6FZ21_NEOLE|nr:hypothetical protein A6R68_09702 [Neotoma lepida]